GARDGGGVDREQVEGAAVREGARVLHLRHLRDRQREGGRERRGVGDLSLHVAPDEQLGLRLDGGLERPGDDLRLHEDAEAKDRRGDQEDGEARRARQAADGEVAARRAMATATPEPPHPQDEQTGSQDGEAADRDQREGQQQEARLPNVQYRVEDETAARRESLDEIDRERDQAELPGKAPKQAESAAMPSARPHVRDGSRGREQEHRGDDRHGGGPSDSAKSARADEAA